METSGKWRVASSPGACGWRLQLAPQLRLTKFLKLPVPPFLSVYLESRVSSPPPTHQRKEGKAKTGKDLRSSFLPPSQLSCFACSPSSRPSRNRKCLQAGSRVCLVWGVGWCVGWGAGRQPIHPRVERWHQSPNQSPSASSSAS